MQSISPFLWFDGQAEEAAMFYVSVFDNSAITGVSRYGEGAPMPAGTALTVDFTLDGLEFHALNGGPQHSFTEAVSFSVVAESQERIDYFWSALTADGGEPGRCGWLTDRFGLSWQVVPPVVTELLTDSDPQRAARVTEALMRMSKIDIAQLVAARDVS
ncbi:VOC family protein [Planctomonas psychrotolerans]|uniref:VOC family protein n=1 Tax=Planctomonas psychrotolerans TaxID=2528712 RepID=UPI00123BDA7F|nr:VOC family protein [Planctomonas psychrotolerans]